jgi:hypothetical protein
MEAADTARTDHVFQDCSSEHVFSLITSQVTTPELRTLWARMREEMSRQGVDAATSYLGDEFTRLRTELGEELAVIELE